MLIIVVKLFVVVVLVYFGNGINLIIECGEGVFVVDVGLLFVVVFLVYVGVCFLLVGML